MLLSVMSNLSTTPLDRIVELVKKIVDVIRCPICDKSNGARGRYPCGHIGCDDCMIITEDCALCLTPSYKTTLKSNFDDGPLTKRVKSANNLLNACQKAFNIDVYKYQRLSGQLKIEKELFPKCIQAPVKYYNKRKSIASSHNKENSLQLFPGEHVSPSHHFKMKKQSKSVQNWLDNNNTYSRKVFSELSVNHPGYIKRSKKDSELGNSILHRKRVYSSSPVKQNEKSFTLNKKIKKSYLENFSVLKDKKQNKHLHEDSGIALDDEPIYIDDSISEIIDKDKLALLAVQQAEQESAIFTSSVKLHQTPELVPQFQAGYQVSKLSNPNKNKLKVPFFRKSHIVETCAQCEGEQSFYDTLETNDHKNISISIDNGSIITTIKITDNNSVENIKDKNSIGVQTDSNSLFGTCSNLKGKDSKENLLKDNEFPNKLEKGKQESQDIFTDDCEFDVIDDESIIHNATHTLEIKDVMPKNKNIVINDSDSDSDTSSDEPIFLNVLADVHVSCEPHNDPAGILSEINLDHSICRSRNKVRGVTPDSNNSSEKENCDPNKSKKLKASKKPKSTKSNTSKLCF